jgi:hypothetical protein
MVQAELARRQESAETYLPFTFVVSRDDGPGVVDDVAEAVKQIEAQTAAGNRSDRVVITREIHVEVEKALAERHPRRFSKSGTHIVYRVVCGPGDAEVMREPWRSEAGTGIAGLPEVSVDPIERAAERLAQLRDGTRAPTELTHWERSDPEA